MNYRLLIAILLVTFAFMVYADTRVILWLGFTGLYAMLSKKP